MKIIEPKQSDTALEITQKRYLMTDNKGKLSETVGEMLWRVAQHVAKPEVLWSSNGEVKEMAELFYKKMVNKKFVCSGKAMFEAGNLGTSGQLAACFVLPIEDKIDVIFKTLGEAAVVHKNNGGTGFNFSKIRPHGDKVKNVLGAASGPVDFIKAYSAALSKILQGAKRQGANIAVLNIDHADILDFIKMKDEDGNLKNFNVSIGVSDEFMEAVEGKKQWGLKNPRTGEVVRKIRADRLFEKICESAHKSGDPGMMFLDTVNRDNPTPNLGRIEATNPCIVGDARVSTDKGLERLEEVVFQNKDKRLVVDKRTVSGQGVGMVALKEGIDQGEKQVYEVETRAGFKVKATKDHRFLTNKGWKELSELELGEKILVQMGEGKFNSSKNLPFKWENKLVGKNGRKYDFNLPTKWSKDLGVFLGWMVGDGFVRLKNDSGYAILTFGNNKLKTKEYFIELLDGWYKGKVSIRKPNGRTIQVVIKSKFVADYLSKLGLLALKSSKKRVPESIFTAPREVVVGFLQGLFGADGTVGFVPGKSAYIRLTSKSRELLEETQLLLISLGIFSKIYDRSRPVRVDQFPKYKSASGEMKRYNSDGVLWELEISKDSVLAFLDKVGFLFSQNEEKIKKLKSKKYYPAKFESEVVKITKLGKRKVYDLVEPETRSFIANGLVVHNCGEIPLLPYESCNLTSIVLSNHLKKKDKGEYEIDWQELRETVRTGVRFLDNLVEVNNYPLDKIERMVKDGNRRVGLGVMGFAHMLYRLKIAYNSDRAVKLSEKLSKFIRKEADKETEKLGKDRGNFGNYDVSIYAGSGKPRRNCATTMIAPTGTTSMFADCSSGIEPVFSLVTLRKTFFEDNKDNRPTRELTMIDPVFEEYLEDNFSKADKQRILEKVASEGLVSGVKELPLKMRRVWVTTHEVEWEYHVKIQAAWQKYFDNSISKTINFKSEATPKEVSQAYKMAWKLGCKGVTIYRDGSKQDQVLNHSKKSLVDVCPECGGKLEVKEGCSACPDCGWSKCHI